jgi:hypothetical protein
VTFAFPTGLTLEQALARIYVSAPEPDCCVVYEDPETRDRVAVFSYSFDQRRTIELWWVDVAGKTHVRTLPESGEATELVSDLYSQLPFAQLDSELLITDSVRRQQARLNFFESLLVRVGEAAGFPERYTINAKATGIWLPTAPTDGPALETVEQDGQVWYLHPGTRTLGSAITTDLIGIVQGVDPNTGKETIATPDVKRFDPVDPEFAIKSAAHAKQTIRQECKQGHVEMDGEATATGWSRVQARARFISDTMNHQGPLGTMLADLYESVLAYARLMTSELDGFCETQRAQVSVRLSPGPVSPEERAAINEQVAAGLLAPETAMVMLGIEDVQGEIDRIRNSPEGQLAYAEKMFTALALGTGAGLTVVTAAKILGFTEEQIGWIEADHAAMPTTETPPGQNPDMMQAGDAMPPDIQAAA